MNRNMKVRNFGLRSRNINKAAKNALREGMESYSSIATMSSRFNQFSEWEYEQYGVKDLRSIETAHLQQYAIHLADRIREGQMGVPTAHNYLSAINRVLEIARGDKRVHVNPIDYISKRTSICTANKAITESDYKKLQNLPLDNPLSANQMAACRLMRAFGLRQKESALLDLKKVIKEALNDKCITIVNGTKGGRLRVVPVRSNQQLECLSEAAKLQGNGRSLIPTHMNYRQWKDAMYKAVYKAGVHGVHGCRHIYAQKLYERLSGVQPPIIVGIKHGSEHYKYIAKTLNITLKKAIKKDQEVREIVARELGHKRITSTNIYLG